MRIKRDLLIGLIVLSVWIEGGRALAWAIGDRFESEVDVHTFVRGTFDVWGSLSPVDIIVNLNGGGYWTYQGIEAKNHPISGETIRVQRFRMRQGGGFADCTCETISEDLECYGGGIISAEWWLDELTLNPVYYWIDCELENCFWGNGYIAGGFRIEFCFDPYLESMREGIPPGMGWEQDLGIWVRNHLDVYDLEQQWAAYGTEELGTGVNGVLFMQDNQLFTICANNPVVFLAGVEECEVETGWCPDVFFSHASMRHHRSTSDLDIDMLTQSAQMATPTPSPTDPPEPTPVPSPTAAGCDASGVRLVSDVEVLVPGIRWNLGAVVCNAQGVGVAGYPLHVVLEYAGQYYWGPSFTAEYDSYVDGYPEFGLGETVVPVIEDLRWPEGVGAGECRIFGVVLTEEGTAVWGEWDELAVRWIE